MSGAERKATDVEEWRPLRISIEQSVITEEEGRQTASFFFSHCKKTCINFQVEGSLDPAVSSSLAGWRRCVPHPSGSFIIKRKKTSLQGHPG